MIRCPSCRYCGEEINDDYCIYYGDSESYAFLPEAAIYHIDCVKSIFCEVEDSDIWLEAISESYKVPTPTQEYNEDDLVDSDAEWFDRFY